jgi:pimeloyl-ACP methyl ester carboxylesterase
MLVLPHHHLQGAILDSLVPPDATVTMDLSHRSQVVNAVGLRVLQQCDAKPACRGMFKTTAEDAYRKLLATPPQDVLAHLPGRNIKQFLGGLLDFPWLRAEIPQLVVELAHGDTKTLRSVKSSLAKINSTLSKYPQSPPSIPLTAIITDSENDARPHLTMAQVKKEQKGLLFASDIPGLMVGPTLPLYTHDKYFGAVPVSLPRVLVLQGTLDPKTPLHGAIERISRWPDQDKVRLVRVTGSPHFILMTAPACFVHAAHQFVAGKRGPLRGCSRPEFSQGL